MASFSPELEKALHRALALANERDHSFSTLEHLLLALTEEKAAVEVLLGCAVDIEILRADLEEYVDNELTNLVDVETEEAKPTAGFQRVIQRSVTRVQASNKEEVTGATVLVAIFAERESHAAYFLQKQDMTRYDAVNFTAHGISKAPRDPALVQGPRPHHAPEQVFLQSFFHFSDALSSEAPIRYTFSDDRQTEDDFVLFMTLLEEVRRDVFWIWRIADALSTITSGEVEIRSWTDNLLRKVRLYRDRAIDDTIFRSSFNDVMPLVDHPYSEPRGNVPERGHHRPGTEDFDQRNRHGYRGRGQSCCDRGRSCSPPEPAEHGFAKKALRDRAEAMFQLAQLLFRRAFGLLMDVPAVRQFWHAREDTARRIRVGYGRAELFEGTRQTFSPCGRRCPLAPPKGG